jgi:hypothetical protein
MGRLGWPCRSRLAAAGLFFVTIGHSVAEGEGRGGRWWPADAALRRRRDGRHPPEPGRRSERVAADGRDSGWRDSAEPLFVLSSSHGA